MDTVKGLIRLARPMTSFSGALATVLGGYVAGTGAWVAIGMAAVVTMLVGAAANAWNDYLDIEIDRVNQPQRALPSGQIAPKVAWRFSVVLSLIGLVLSAFINLPSFLITLGSLTVLYIYSWRLKSTVLMGNLTVAAVSAMSVIFGGAAAGHPRPSLLLAGIISVAILGREVLKTLADYDGDLHQNCRTVSTVWGKNAARLIFYMLTVLTVWVMLMPHLLQLYKPVYAYVVIVGVLPVIIYVLLQVSPGSSGRKLQRLSQLMKFDFLVWFVAVLLGAG